jgi:hypothetical protein
MIWQTANSPTPRSLQTGNGCIVHGAKSLELKTEPGKSYRVDPQLN